MTVGTETRSRYTLDGHCRNSSKQILIRANMNDKKGLDVPENIVICDPSDGDMNPQEDLSAKLPVSPDP